MLSTEPAKSQQEIAREFLDACVQWAISMNRAYEAVERAMDKNKT